MTKTIPVRRPRAANSIPQPNFAITEHTQPSFADEQINRQELKKRAYNLRWASVDNGVIPLTAADPDFPVAIEIERAISDYTSARLFSYGPPEGLPEFRSVIAETLYKRKKVRTRSEFILPVDGAASGMFTIARFALEPEDEAIIFDPVDFLFQQSIEAAGARVVRLPFDLQSRTFDPHQLMQLITPKTKMIAVCNPHNPLGRVLTIKELKAIAALAIKHDLWIMNDEIWSDIVYRKEDFMSIVNLHPKVAERTITVNGFSKTFGLAGLRVGYIVAPNAKVHQGLMHAARVQSTSAGVSTLSQIAATAAYRDCWYWADSFLQHLAEVRDYAVRRLNAMNGVSCRAPEGTYVLLVNIESFGMDSETMATYLLKTAKVSVVPGAAKWFGPKAEGHIRICFSTSMKMMEIALNQIAWALSLLR